MQDTVLKYFPNLTDLQKEQFAALFDLYADWNSKINVISRKDFDNFYEHHILHSLSIAKITSFKSGTSIIDVGCGGGFPGIPLAIFFPNVSFVLLDSIGKKIKVCSEVASAINLKNVECIHSRIEDEKRKFDFVVSRAVMPLADLAKLTRKNIKKEQQNAFPNGIICLKGGDLQEETKPFRKIVSIMDIQSFYSEPFFETKKIVHLPL